MSINAELDTSGRLLGKKWQVMLDDVDITSTISIISFDRGDAANAQFHFELPVGTAMMSLDPANHRLLESAFSGEHGAYQIRVLYGDNIVAVFDRITPKRVMVVSDNTKFIGFMSHTANDVLDGAAIEAQDANPNSIGDEQAIAAGHAKQDANANRRPPEENLQ